MEETEVKDGEGELLALTKLGDVPLTPALIASNDFAVKYEYLTLVLQKLGEVKKNIDGTIKDIVKDNYLSTGKNSVASEGYRYTYVPEGTREALDVKAIKKEEPELYRKYIKISTTSDSLRVTRIVPKDETVVDDE